MEITGNLRYIADVTEYIVDGNDGTINVDTSVNSVNIILPNINNSGFANTSKGFIINDISSNASVNNIVITSNGNSVNSAASVVISSDGGSAKCSVANINEWFVITEPQAGASIIQPISGTLTHNAYTEGALSLLINVPAQPQYIVFSSDTLYILDSVGDVLVNLSDPVGVHALTFYGFSIGNGFGNDYANISALNFSQQILTQDPDGNPLGTIPTPFLVQQSVCFLNGMRWIDSTDAGTYGNCSNFTNSSFTLNITPYGNYPFVSTIIYTVFF